jgi:hypothetical protein
MADPMPAILRLRVLDTLEVVAGRGSIEHLLLLLVLMEDG